MIPGEAEFLGFRFHAQILSHLRPHGKGISFSFSMLNGACKGLKLMTHTAATFSSPFLNELSQAFSVASRQKRHIKILRDLLWNGFHIPSFSFWFVNCRKRH